MSDQGVKVVFIKKKAKGHGHHGGAWKVAYADFVTAMMALFIVLWLLTQSDQASKEKIAEYFRTGRMPGGSLVLGSPGGSNPPMAVTVFPSATAAIVESKHLNDLAKEVEKMLGKRSKDAAYATLSKHVKVRVVNEGALIELVEGGDDFLFNVASADLKPGAIKILEDIAPALASLPNRIEIHGHTDARPFGSASSRSNWDLSFERANEARRVLESNGIAKGKIQSVMAHADTALYRPDQPFAPENRRLAILVVRRGSERDRTGEAQEARDGQVAPGALPPGTPGLAPDGAPPAPNGAQPAPAPAPDEEAPPSAPKKRAVEDDDGEETPYLLPSERRKKEREEQERREREGKP